jgi:phosphotransferase system enzyme I (PtsP)
VSDAYLRERLADLDDLSNRLLRILTGQGGASGADLPPDPILIARNIGPGELLEYGRSLKGIVLEEGSVGSMPPSWRERLQFHWSYIPNGSPLKR